MALATMSRGASSARGIEAIHESATLSVAQHRTLATQRLGHQPGRVAWHIERRGMELDEFQIRKRCSSIEGKGQAVPHGPLGAGATAEDSARPAGGHHHTVGDQFAPPFHGDTIDLVVAQRQVSYPRPEPLDPFVLLHRGEQRFQHHPSRCVAARVEDPTRAVPALQRRSPFFIERHTAIAQLPDGERRVRGQRPRPPWGHTGRLRPLRCRGVRGRVVTLSDGGGDSAHRQRGGTALGGIGRDDRDRPALGGVESAP